MKLAHRERPVVALIGDGAFLYNPTIPCLGFSREAKLPILIVIYNNHGYRAMRDSQLAYYPDGAGARSRQFCGETIDGFDTGLLEDFVRAFAQAASLTVHVHLRYGRSPHHICEAEFKALAKALGDACALTGRGDVPSTKGTL